MCDWVCDCGCEISFPSLEEEGGFIKTDMTCPECGTVWVLRLTKRVGR